MGEEDRPARPPEGAKITGSLERASPRKDETVSEVSPPSPAASSPSLSVAVHFAPGDLIANRYRVVRFIARGGMGEVYEVEDQELRERVALKTVKPEIAADAGALERFRREVHFARRVTHPNVCRIFDLGIHTLAGRGGEERLHFLTMELLDGETLSQRLLGTGPLGEPEALGLLRQMAAALAAAHTAGVIHRDFKSGNVVLIPSPEGERAVVTDFGLARAMGGASLVESFTGTNVVGTPAYMAPEQVEGRPVGPAADIYALGVVLFEMLTHHRPFEGESAISIAVRRLHQKPPSPRSLRSDLDARWEAVILRCLERRPEDRFGSAQDVLRALEGERVAPGHRESRRRAILAVAALGVALLVGWAVARHGQPPAPGGTARSERRAVAVLGLKNLGRSEEGWLSTALSEMLRTELAVGEQVRTIPGETVARLRIELGLSDDQLHDSLARDTLSRVASNSGAQIVVLGSYLAAGSPGSRRVRLDLRMQDASDGEMIRSLSETGAEDDPFALVSAAGSKLRQALGLGAVSPEQEAGVKAALPGNATAAQLYAEGLARLRAFDALTARDRLEQAVAADPDHPLAHAALAQAWSGLGYDGKAREAAQRAHELGGRLAREERLGVEAAFYEATRQWDKAVQVRRSLFLFFPDHIDFGLALVSTLVAAGRASEALDTIEELRRLPDGGDARIDLAEATAAKALTDFARQERAATAAAAKARAQGARLLLAHARLAEASALVNVGQVAKAEEAAREARGLFEAAGDIGGVARAENVLGVGRATEGDFPAAKARFEAALEASRRIGDQRNTAVQLGNIAGALDGMGRPAEAKAAYAKALDVTREIGDDSSTARTLLNLAVLEWNQKDAGRALRHYEEALVLFRALGETRNVAVALNNIGEVLLERGDVPGAVARFEESLKISRPTGDSGLVAESLRHRARVAQKQGRLEDALRDLEEARSLYGAAREKEGEAATLRHMSEVLSRLGRPADAARRREEAEAIERALAASD